MTIDELKAFLSAQPQDRDAWLRAVNANFSNFTAEERRYEEGYADGAIQAYGFILDLINSPLPQLHITVRVPGCKCPGCDNL